MSKNSFLTASVMTVLATASAEAETFKISIAPQPLGEAISQLSRSTGLDVAISDSLANERFSQGVRGEMSPQQALLKLLVGTSLSLREPDENSVLVTDHEVVTQNAIENTPFDLGTLVVRGELLERSVQDSQTSAVVVAGEELEARSCPSPVELGHYTGGERGIGHGEEATFRRRHLEAAA
ncbi:MAG: STN domain-containing protein [Cyanobacteria bacterium P01_G01_bin.4]